MHPTFSTEILDLIPHQVWTATAEGNLDYFNKQWFEYSRWDLEQSKDLGWALAIHPDDLPSLTEIWKRSLATEQPYQTKARVLRHDGNYRWFSIHAQPIYREDGSLLKWVGTNTDVDDLVMTGEELNDSHYRLDKVQKGLLDAKEQRIISEAHQQKTMASLERLQIEIEDRIEIRTTQLSNDKFEAISEKEKMHRFFMQAPAGICILDGPDFVYELVNPAYQQLFPGRILQGMQLFKALPEFKNHPIANVLRNVYSTGETFVGKAQHVPLAYEERGPVIDRYFDFVYQARYNEKGKIDGVFVFAFEMTMQVNAMHALEQSKKELQKLYNDLAASNKEIQAANEELHAANEEITAANEEVQSSNDELFRLNSLLQGINTDLDNFVYTASHDLKSPISNLEGLVTVLKENLLDGGDREISTQVLDLMDDSIARFRKTLNDLSDISRIQFLGNSEASMVSIKEILEEIILDLRQEISSSHAQVSTPLGNCSEVFISRKNLRSVLYNLISNGIKYRHPDRPCVIEVSCRQDHDSTVVQVKDTGLGIENDKLHKLFGMFERLHTHVDGSGVGLYMVKKIVENAGGRIEVDSSPEGSVFTVHLVRESR